MTTATDTRFTTRTAGLRGALTLVLALGALSGCGSDPTAPTTRPDPITSSFGVSTEGWTGTGAYTGLRRDTVLKPGDATSDGFLRARDKAEGATWYFVAPSGYRGDLSPYYGGTLRYRVRVGMGVNALGGYENGEYFNDSDIVLRGGGLTLVYGLTGNDYPSSNYWSTVQVGLDDASGWVVVGERSRRRATREQMEQVLANVTDLRIRGEYFVGVDWGALDYVTIQAK